MSDFEQNIVGSLLVDPAGLADIDLMPQHFAQKSCAAVYETIQHLVGAGEVIDVLTVSDELEKRTNRNWLPYLAELSKNTIFTPNLKRHAEAVKAKSVERFAQSVAARLIEDLPSQGLASVDQAIVDLMSIGNESKKTVFSLRESLQQAHKYLSDTLDKNGLTGITTGLSDLDDFIGGFHDTDLVVIGARPAMGKTALLLNFAFCAGVPCGIHSTEQAALQVALRFLSMQSRVDSRLVRNAELDDFQWSSVTTATTKLLEKQIWIDEQSTPSISEIARQARRWKQQHDVKIIFVDYIQRIKGGDPRQPKHERVEAVVVGLKSLAKELNVPVVALAQVNRDVEKRADKRPGMGDLKDSGAIEQEADVIGMLYRDEVYNPDTDEKGIAEINIEKNRHGPIAMVRAAWLGSIFKFENITTMWGAR